MINAIHAALSGLMTSAHRAEKAAANIAQSGSAPAQSDLITDLVEIKHAQITYKANLATLKTVQNMTQDFFRHLDKSV